LNWRKLLTKAAENWPAKVLSLALAIVLFVFHRMSTLETRSFFTPIVIEYLDGMMPASPYPRIIRVNVRGDPNSIYSILESDIETYVDMGRFNTPGTYIVPVQWRKKNTAHGVELLQISVEPPEITFTLDIKISKFVPISANFRGQVEAGFNMTSFTLNPSYIIIDGPVEIMSTISELYTEPIDLDGRRNTFSMTMNVLQQEPLVVIRGNGITEFYGIISEVIPARDISDVPIMITGVREGFSAQLEINTANVHLEGDNLDEVNSFVPPPDFLRVDFSGISEPGTYILRVLVGEAENIDFRTEPREVTGRIYSARTEAYGRRYWD
jgi:YbbR domain-containing protein